MYGIILHTKCSSYFITQIVWPSLFSLSPPPPHAHEHPHTPTYVCTEIQDSILQVTGKWYEMWLYAPLMFWISVFMFVMLCAVVKWYWHF